MCVFVCPNMCASFRGHMHLNGRVGVCVFKPKVE